MKNELPQPVMPLMTQNELDRLFVGMGHTGNENPMWHFGLMLMREMNQLVSDRIEAPPRDGNVVSLACFDREDHAGNIEVYGAWVDREINPADALDALTATHGLRVVSSRRERTPLGVIGDDVVEWDYEGRPFAGRMVTTKCGPRLFTIWARCPRENYAALADAFQVSIASFTITDKRPGPLAEVVNQIEGWKPVAWKASVPKSWRVATRSSSPASASFPALLSGDDGQLLGRLLFVITAVSEAGNPIEAATRHLGSLLPPGLVGKQDDWTVEEPTGPFEESWLLVRPAEIDGAKFELRCRVARHVGAWVIAGVMGPPRDQNLGVWMACKRLLDLVTFELEISGSRRAVTPVIERPPIDSRVEFLRQLRDALPFAERLAAEHPGEWQYHTIAQLMSSMDMMTDERDPRPDETASMGPMLDTLRQQSPDPSPDMADLLSRFGALTAFFVNWPATSAVVEPVEPEDDTSDLVPIDSLEEFVRVLRHAIDAADPIRDTLQVQMNDRRRASAAGRGIEAIGDVSGKLHAMLRAVAEWVRGEATFEAVQRGELRIGTRIISALRSGPGNLLAETCRRIDEFRKMWSVPRGVSGEKLERFEDLIISLHRVREIVANLQIRFKESEFVDGVNDHAERLLRLLGEWVNKGTIPSGTDRERLEFGPVIAAHHALHTMPELQPLIERIRTVGLGISDWPPAFRDSFLRELYDTDIEAKLLLLQTGDPAFMEVERRLQLAVYSAADGRIDTDYGRSQIDFVEAYEKHLAIYVMTPVTDLLPLTDRIDSFVKSWNPRPIPDSKLSPMEQAMTMPIVTSRTDDERRDEDEGVDDAGGTDHDDWDESRAFIAATNAGAGFDGRPYIDEDGAAAARSLDHGYWWHLLESAIRSFSTERTWLPMRREVGLALRAIRRWIGNGHPASADYREAVSRLFRSLAFDPDRFPNGVSYPREMIEAQTLHAYFQLWPNPADALARATEKPRPDPNGVIPSPEVFAEIVDETLADAELLAGATHPPRKGYLALARALRRVQQSIAHARNLLPREKLEIDALLSAVEPPTESFPFVPDFATDFVSRVRRLNDYFQGRRISSPAAFFELLHATHAELRKTIQGRVWDEDKTPMAALERQFRALIRWTLGGRKPSPTEREGSRTVLRLAASLRGADQLPEFVRRCGEIAEALDRVFPGGDEAPVIPPPQLSDRESIEQATADAIADAQSLSARGMFAQPTPPQAFWENVRQQLGRVQKLLDPELARTERERHEIEAALTGPLEFDGNPFPQVHDFRENLTARLHLISQAFAALSVTAPYAAKEAKSLPAGATGQLTFGRGVMMYFVRIDDPIRSGIYACRYERKHSDAEAGGIEISVSEFLPTTRDLIMLVDTGNRPPKEMRVSPGGEFIAYMTDSSIDSGGVPAIGWCNTSKPEQSGAVSGSAFTWTSNGRSLLVVEPGEGKVSRIDPTTGESREVIRVPAHALSPVPMLSVSPDGGRVAVALKPVASSATELHVIVSDGRAMQLQKVASVSPTDAGGEIQIIPFWSKNTGELHYLARSTRTGHGEICTTAAQPNENPERLNASTKAVWLDTAPSCSPTGRWIAFLQRSSGGKPTVFLLDCDLRKVTSLEAAGTFGGRLEFGDESVLIHGGDAAVSLWLKNLPQKRIEPERF